MRSGRAERAERACGSVLELEDRVCLVDRLDGWLGGGMVGGLAKRLARG